MSPCGVTPKFCSPQCRVDAEAARHKADRAARRAGQSALSAAGQFRTHATLRLAPAPASAAMPCAMRSATPFGTRHGHSGRRRVPTAAKSFPPAGGAARSSAPGSAGPPPGQPDGGSGHPHTCASTTTRSRWRSTTLSSRRRTACALCRTDTPRGQGGWHVDHDHVTGQIRGLLCQGCNIAIGLFAHDEQVLTAAISYLDKHGAPDPTPAHRIQSSTVTPNGSLRGTRLQTSSRRQGTVPVPLQVGLGEGGSRRPRGPANVRPMRCALHPRAQELQVLLTLVRGHIPGGRPVRRPRGSPRAAALSDVREEFTPQTSAGLTCSRKCGNDWANAQKQQRKRAQWEQDKSPAASAAATSARPGDEVRCTAHRNARSTRSPHVGARGSPVHAVGSVQGHARPVGRASSESQDGGCTICRTDVPGGKGGWHLDHDHATGQVRGILCHRCNLALGYFGDDRDRVRSAIEYLRRHRALATEYSRSSMIRR